MKEKEWKMEHERIRDWIDRNPKGTDQHKNVAHVALIVLEAVEENKLTQREVGDLLRCLIHTYGHGADRGKVGVKW